MVRRPIADYVHRFTVIALLGLTGWGVWLTGAVYVSRVGHTERIPYGSPDRDSLTVVVGRLVDRWKEANKIKGEQTQSSSNKMV